MKNQKFYLSLVAVTGCAALASATLQAQQLARYPISPANSFNSPSVLATQVAPNITASPLSPTGVDPLHFYIGFEGHLLFRHWSEGIAPVADDKYLSFTITPNPGFKVRFSTITYTLGSRVPNASWQLRSSVDNYTADFGAHATQPGPDADQYVFTDNVSSLGTQTGPVTFRLYGYNEVSTNYSGLLNNVNFFGGQRGTDVLVNGTVSDQNLLSSATFVGKDTATQGNWGGAYSVDGHHIINHSVNYPSYAQVTASGNTDYTWASSTSEVRALRKKGATTDRIAACWYSTSNFTIDLNLTDGLSHRIALYCLDWDSTVRAQQIDILDSFDNSVLSSQSVSGFNGGQYLIWEIKGHVLLRVTNTGSINAVISGIFFDPAGEPPPPPPPVRTLTVASSNPSAGVLVSITPNDNNNQGDGTTSSSFTRTYVNNTPVTLTAPSSAGGNNFQKWQRDGVDWSTSLSTSVTMDGDHMLTVVYVAPSPPPPPATSATFVGKDTVTQGNWGGVYSVDGHHIINHSVNYPTYATVTATGNTDYTWASSTSEVRALRKKGATTDRIAACWYSIGSFTIDLNLTDGLSHRIALYCLDWDSTVRLEQIDILNASDNSVLSSQGVTGFNGGQYLIWEIKGHVLIRFTNLGSFNAVLSGIFFDPAGEPPPPPPPLRTLTVASSNPGNGVSVTVSPNDNNAQGNGSTSFTRTYNNNTEVTLTAPSTAGGNNFAKWQRDGVDAGTTVSTTVTMGGNHTMTAVYVVPPPLTRTLTVASSNPGSGVSVTVSPNDNSAQGNGSTSFTRTYNNNTQVTLTAPSTAGGNNFAKWQRDGVDAGTTVGTTVTMDANHTMTAIYVVPPPPARTLTVASSNPGSGVSVTISPNDNSAQGNGSTSFTRTYNNNTQVTLTAPSTAGGNNFAKWQRDGVDAGTTVGTTVTMDANHTMTAIYVVPPPPARTLTVASSNPGSGVSVTISPNDNSAQGNGSTSFTRTYNNNTQVTLTAPSTAGGNNFAKWQRDGVDAGTTVGTTVTMDANHTMTAIYVVPPPPARTLTVASSNPGSGVSVTISPNDNSAQGNGSTSFTRTYNNNTQVTLTAPSTAGGNNFAKWQRDGVDAGTTVGTTVTMDANHTMTAIYVVPPPPARTLTVASSNPGSGVSVTISPNDNSAQGNGSTSFTRTYNNNTQVTLTAPSTAGGNNFAKWQRDGVDAGTTVGTTVTMDANHTMTAIYVVPPPPARTLTVASSNPGSGVSVTISPNDNSAQGNGSTSFTRTYNNNTQVTLTAPSTAGGNNFAKWQRDGVDAGTTVSTTVTMDANHTMTAIYVVPPPPARTLTVASSNPGSGVSVTISPNDNSAQGNGSTSFTRTYNNNTQVTLTAPSTAGGNNFAKWQRDGVDAGTTVSTTVIMSANHTMTAVYVVPPPPTRTLTVASSNPGSGVSVTVSPNDNSAQGNGATSFTRTYNNNTQVTLTAPSTAGGNNFAKWQRDGVDAGTTVSTTVIMSANHTMTAVYVVPPPPTRTLTVASSNPGSGVSVTVSPNDNSAQGNGATSFTRTYNNNTQVTLTAPSTAGGNNFTKWQRDGVDAGTTVGTTVTMDANHTMTAVYVVPPPPTRTLTVASSNPGSGVSVTVSPNDNSAQGNGATSFTRTYNNNTQVTLTAPSTAGGNNFTKWQRDGVDAGTTVGTTVTMDANHTMTAIYVVPPPPARTLTVASSNPGSGVSVTVSPNDNSAQGNGSTSFTRTYNNNTQVTLTAPSTAGGNNFAKWQRDGVDAGTTVGTTVTMDANHTMTAIYVVPPPPARTLTVASSNPGSGVSVTVSPNDNSAQGNGSTSFTRTYNNNTQVTLTAPSTAGGNNFAKWQRDGVDAGTTVGTTVTMDANHTMTAIYVVPPPPARTLTVASSNPGSGVSVTVSPNDNSAQGNGSTSFTRTYNNNTPVTLTASSTAGGNNFAKWQRDGVDVSTTVGTTVTMDANHTMTAVYVVPPLATPSAPSGLTATAVSSSQINLNWTGVSNETGYRLKRSTTSGGPYTQVGGDLAANTSSFGNLGLSADTTYYFVVTAFNSSGESPNSNQASATTSSSGACRIAIGGGPWVNTAFNAQTGMFTAEFDATPSTGTDNAVAGLSNGSATEYASQACIVRFRDGHIEARRGGHYSAESTINYTPGIAYHFRLVVDLSGHTYSIYVTPAGGSEILVGSDYAFRNEQKDVTQLNNWAVFADKVGSVQVCNFLATTGVSRALTIASANPSSGVSIIVSPGDGNAEGDGATSLTRTYNDNTPVTLTAPSSAGGHNFQIAQNTSAYPRRFVIRLSGQVGLTYQVEVSTDLVNWSRWREVILQQPEVELLDAANSESHQRFYRLVPTGATPGQRTDLEPK